MDTEIAMPSSRVRLAAALWLLAMTGVVALTFTVVPTLLARQPATLPLPLVLAVSLVQSAAFTAVAIWTGVVLSGQTGLGAPTCEAMVGRGDVLASLRRQLGPAAVAGLLCGWFLLALAPIVPSGLQDASRTLAAPLVAKLFYGGITEEILMRWGVMTALLWLFWRFVQRRQGAPRTRYVVAAIVGSALLFGLGHLPAVIALGIRMTPEVFAFVTLGNLAPGIVFGTLYRRYGIEAAMIAHALAHLVATR
jgi:hypothetical protein